MINDEIPSHWTNKEKRVWNAFVKKERLSSEQSNKFAQYIELLRVWNKKINLTRITDIDAIIWYHFQDSLQIRSFVDLSLSKGIVDVGTGAGFPGIPLAVVYPNLPVVLVEVNEKKIGFLREVITTLGITNCSISDLDWRTFIRKTDYSVDYIFARASLRPEELVRAFQAHCPYRNSTIVYWASSHWKLGPAVRPFFKKEEIYAIKDKKRKYVFLQRDSQK